MSELRFREPLVLLVCLLSRGEILGQVGPAPASAAQGRHAAAAEETPSTKQSQGTNGFQIRGTLPWHNFLSGPSTWTEGDYRAYLDEMARRKLNLLGLHCYTGGAERYAPYVEPMIRLRYREVVPEASWDTSLTARWGYRPLAIQDFAFGTSALFLDRTIVPESRLRAFGSPAALAASDNEDRYRRAHELTRKVIEMAHARGIQVAIGFEFGVHPPEFASVVPPDSRIDGALLPDPTHPANIEILRSALGDILSEYPGVDWIWLWLHEHSMFVAEPVLKGKFKELFEREKAHFGGAAKPHDVFTGVWSLAQIHQAHAHLAQRSPHTRLVIGGWGGGPQLPPVLEGLDRALPTNIVFSCLNPDMGTRGHAPVLNAIAAHRPVWSIPWLEGDSWLWHLQLRAGSMIEQVKAAAAAHLEGVVAIHWRTEETRANLEAFALAASDPSGAPSAEQFYLQHACDRFGEQAAPAAARLLLQLERDRKLGHLASPEFFPYDPTWGRMPPELATELRTAVMGLDRLKSSAGLPEHRANLEWLTDNLRFALLLDEVGRKMEAAYRLKDAFFAGDVQPMELQQRARSAAAGLAAAPVEELFRTFARRVRSRGELGELSALNQKLWLQYQELTTFLRQTRRLLVVAPRGFQDGLKEFISHKRERLAVELVTLEDVLARSQGADDPEKLKRYLYGRWRNEGLGYVLLVGDADVVPVRFMVLDRVTPAAFDYAFYPSDLYYGDLAKPDGSFESWNARQEGFHAGYFGEVRGEKNKRDPINYDEVDYRPEVAVGRWPASTPEEVRLVAAKTISYEKALAAGGSTTRARAAFLAVGGWVDSRPLLDRLAAGLTNGWTVEKRFYSDRGAAAREPGPSPAQVRTLLNNGLRLLVHTGHGQPDAWEQCFSVRDLDLVTNGACLPVVISAGCSTAYFAPLPPYGAYVDVEGKEHAGSDNHEVFHAPPPPPAPYQRDRFNPTGLGEQMLKRSTNGAVAYIGCNTGSQPCALTLVRGFVDAIAQGKGPLLGDCWVSALHFYHEHEHLEELKPNEDWYPPSIFFQGMKFMLYGDPSLPIFNKE